MPKLPNPPKSKKLTKKVGLECLAILNEIDRVLFDSRMLQAPALWITLNKATGGKPGGPDAWISEMHDRIIDARANLNAWKDAEAEDKRRLRREEYATDYVTVVNEEGKSPPPSRCGIPRTLGASIACASGWDAGTGTCLRTKPRSRKTSPTFSAYPRRTCSVSSGSQRAGRCSGLL